MTRRTKQPKRKCKRDSYLRWLVKEKNRLWKEYCRFMGYGPSFEEQKSNMAFCSIHYGYAVDRYRAFLRRKKGKRK